MIDWLARLTLKLAGPAVVDYFCAPIGQWKLVRYWPPWRRGQYRRLVHVWGPFIYEGREYQYATGAEILAGQTKPREVRWTG